MIRLAILSDIHGNLPALEAVLEDLHRQRPVDGILVAGDYTGGPQPVETIRLLRTLGSWMILGNGDVNLLQYDQGEAQPARYTHQQFALMRWAYRHLDAETLAYLRSLPEQRAVRPDGVPTGRGAVVRVVHGAPWDPAVSLWPDRRPERLARALAEVKEPVLVCGHTHVPWKREHGGRLVLNPGAVCGPLDGSVGAQYALLTGQDDRWDVEHRTVPYDMEQLRVTFRESGLLEEGGAQARALLLCLETGRNIWRDFLTYARRLAAEAGFEEGEAVPDEIWKRADATFNWDGVKSNSRT